MSAKPWIVFSSLCCISLTLSASSYGNDRYLALSQKREELLTKEQQLCQDRSQCLANIAECKTRLGSEFARYDGIEHQLR